VIVWPQLPYALVLISVVQKIVLARLIKNGDSEFRTLGNHPDIRVSALYMDSSSLANSYIDQNSDAFVYSASVWRRYLRALYVCALRFL
jgi:hypothetical protein